MTIANTRPKRKCREETVPKYREEPGGDAASEINDGGEGIPFYKNPHMPAGGKLLLNQICKFMDAVTNELYERNFIIL